MKAYELIDKPEKWCQNYAAKDERGKYHSSPIFLDDPAQLTQMCVETAMKFAYPDYDAHMAAKTNLRLSIDTDCVYKWNDAPERTWQEVYDLLKELDI